MGGESLEDTSARGYQTTATLDVHTDGADLVGLRCLRQAPASPVAGGGFMERNAAQGDAVCMGISAKSLG